MRAVRIPTERNTSALRLELLHGRYDDRALRRLREADGVPEGITERAVRPVEPFLRLLGELDARRLQPLVVAAAVVGLEDHAAGGSLRHELPGLGRGRFVVDGR